MKRTHISRCSFTHHLNFTSASYDDKSLCSHKHLCPRAMLGNECNAIKCAENIGNKNNRAVEQHIVQVLNIRLTHNPNICSRCDSDSWHIEEKMVYRSKCCTPCRSPTKRELKFWNSFRCEMFSFGSFEFCVRKYESTNWLCKNTIDISLCQSLWVSVKS